MRLDQAITARGLARSRTDAARSIAAGRVLVNGNPAHKASLPVTEADEISLTRPTPYVSRAATKLLHALDVFPIETNGRFALDAGASTGGFTQVLLERGCRQVIALDVGHDQLASPLRNDPRVVVIEGENARYLSLARLDHTVVRGRTRT